MVSSQLCHLQIPGHIGHLIRKLHIDPDALYNLPSNSLLTETENAPQPMI